MNAQFRRWLSVGILCLPCGVSSVSGQQFEPADEEPAKPAAPPSLPPEPTSAEEDAEVPTEILWEKFLNREKLPVGQDGKRVKSWPIKTLQQILTGEIKLIVQLEEGKSYLTKNRPVRSKWLSALRESALSYTNSNEDSSIEYNRTQLLAGIEQQLTYVKKELLDDKRTGEQSVILDDLRFLYQLRFDLDTAYQDLKVSEIETRAKKLREEIERREAAVEKWVDAKITLDKMKADGIDVGVTNFPLSRPEFSSSSSYPAPTPLAIPPRPDPNQAVPSLAPSLPTFQAQ